MPNRKFLPIFLLAFALAAPAAIADPSPGAAAQGNKYKTKAFDQKDRGPRGVPPGHLPPPGQCRVWYDGLPPGQQPRATDCDTARREASRTGGRVIFGDGHEAGFDEDWWEDDQWRSRFDRLDRNDDGFLSRSEWPGDERIFDRLDSNDDARLSRAEIQNRDFDRGDLLEERFRENDDNRDGRLSLSEWEGREEVFELLDRNDDGFVSRAEFLNREFERSDLLEERFREHDVNGDGRLSLREWWGRDDTFEGLDRNDDSFLSRSEILDRNRGDYSLSDRRFHELDRNRDGRLSEREWSGQLADFNRTDRNNDGFVSLDEWLRRS